MEADERGEGGDLRGGFNGSEKVGEGHYHHYHGKDRVGSEDGSGGDGDGGGSGVNTDGVEGMEATYRMYDDKNNPFHDLQLSKPFQWRFKRGDVEETEEEIKARKEKTWRELVELKKKRELREAQLLQRETEQEKISRERQLKYAIVYEREEDRFLLAQLKFKSLSHFNNSNIRPQIIDLMYLVYSVYLRMWLEEKEFSSPEVKSSLEYQVLQIEEGLCLPANLPFSIDYVGKVNDVGMLNDLVKDVTLFQRIETERLSYLVSKLKGDEQLPSAYWSAIFVLLEGRAMEIDEDVVNPDQIVILPEIKPQVDDLLRNKSTAELKELSANIRTILKGEVLIDAEYWQAVSRRSDYFKALAYVRQIHEKILNKVRSGDSRPGPNSFVIPEELDIQTDMANTRFLLPKDNEDVEFTNGGKPFHGGSDFTDDYIPDRMYEEAHLNNFNEYLDENALYQIEKSKGMDINEEAFGEGDDEVVDVETKNKFGLYDKFLPRKPKYFNRVKTGYEWTKYNQAHYDIDNPPPKVIQGYKFTIFYPDLIDPKKVPGYSIEPSDSPDFVILRFIAGPPYLDIAFRIANKEWSLSQKHGFKSLFTRGVLHLWFNFKRLSYKR